MAVDVAAGLSDAGLELAAPSADSSPATDLSERARMQEYGFLSQTNLFLTNQVELNIRVYDSSAAVASDLDDSARTWTEFAAGRDLYLVWESAQCGTIGVSSFDMISSLDSDPRPVAERESVVRDTMADVDEFLTDMYGPCESQ